MAVEQRENVMKQLSFVLLVSLMGISCVSYHSDADQKKWNEAFGGKEETSKVLDSEKDKEKKNTAGGAQ